MADIVGSFNDILEGKTVLLIDEVDSANKRAMSELKVITGSARITLRAEIAVLRKNIHPQGKPLNGAFYWKMRFSIGVHTLDIFLIYDTLIAS